MNRALGLLLTAGLMLSSFGCGNIVTTAGANGTDDVPGGGTGGSTNVSTTSSSSSGGNDPVQGKDIAVTNGDFLEVQLASYLQTCGVDGQPGCGAEAVWLVSFKLPLAKLTPGSTLTLQEANGFSSGTDVQDPANPGVCSGGGGTYWDGTVQVLATTDSTVTLRLAGTMPLFFAPSSADGDYVVELCGQKPPPGHALTSAVATQSSVSPQNLTLHVTNLANSCADPDLTLQGCSVEHEGVSIELSPAMQTPGTYSLDQIATFSDWMPGQGGCSGGGGSYWGGSIEITSIDATSVAFSLTGTDPMFTGKANADGSYTAPRCN